MFDLNEIRKRAQQASEQAADSMKKTLDKSQEILDGIQVPDSEDSPPVSAAEAEEQIAAASKTYEDEFSKLRDEMDKKYAEYQALDAATPQAIKDRRMQELQELSNRIQAFSEQAQQDLARQQQTLAAPIQDKITNAIKKVGADNGFTFIFPKGLAAYSGADVVDCTDMVKAALGVK